MSSTKIAKKLKIDHSLGDTINPSGADYAWDTSLLGINAKDISDAVAGAIYNAKMNLATDGTNLLQIWDEENIILTPEQLKTRSLNLVKEMGFLLPSHA
jgi:hypothetical protein